MNKLLVIMQYFKQNYNIYIKSNIKNIWYDSESLKFIKNIKNLDLKTCVYCK